MKKCPCCHSELIVQTIFNKLPSSSAALDIHPTFEIPNAGFDAAICDNCKYITNANESRFNTVYSNQLYVLKTAVTNSMSTNLKLILDFIIQGRTDFSNFSVLEIGSGAGEVALWLDRQGANVYTVDPAISGYENSGICHYGTNFDYQLASSLNQKFDLIICRHIIEHTEDPQSFLTICDSVLNESGKIYIEVPNLIDTLESDRLVDFFNDHIQYFTENSFRLLAQTSQLYLESKAYWLNQAHIGLMLSHSNQTQYINNPENINIIESLDRSETKFKTVLNEMKNYNNIVIYGAGAHACTFASQIPNDLKTKIKYVFDRSSAKQGRYLPGIQTPISEPTQSSILDQQLVVNTSSLYKKEVESFLTNDLNWSGVILHL